MAALDPKETSRHAVDFEATNTAALNRMRRLYPGYLQELK
jgi:hypothetical protein